MVLYLAWFLPLCSCSAFHGGWVPISLGFHCLSFRLPSRDLFRRCLEQLDFGWADRASGTGTRCSLAKAGKPTAGFLQIWDCISIRIYEPICIYSKILIKIRWHLYFQKIPCFSNYQPCSRKNSSYWLITRATERTNMVTMQFIFLRER